MVLIKGQLPEKRIWKQVDPEFRKSSHSAHQIRQAAWRAEEQLQARRPESSRRSRHSKRQRSGKTAWTEQLENLKEFTKQGEDAPKGSVKWHAFHELHRIIQDQPQF